MDRKSCLGNRFLAALIISLAAATPATVRAQDMADNMVGQNEQAWQIWSAAMRSVERDELAEAATGFESLAQYNLSDLRLALMADRTGTVRLEQWSAKDDAPQPVKDLAAKIENGRKQKTLAEDGLHYAVMGQFAYADANFKALDEANPDPVALLELVRMNPNRQDTLLKVINNSDVGDSARRFLAILSRGEELLRRDPYEIVANIGKLGGAPRMAYNATNRLKVSGEYAIPHLLQALQDSGRSKLHPFIIQVIPQIGRSGLNPLVQSLGMSDDVTKTIVINSLAKIGYKQAVPYLARLAHDSNQSPEVRTASESALSKLGVSGSTEPAPLFYDLAGLYYDNTDSLQADDRSDEANVWYLRGNDLKYVAVPRNIFNDIMAMRCSEEALKLQNSMDGAVALWLAANYRREARLGLDVESDEPTPLANRDSTRPEGYPRSIYFGRAAGARYNHMVLGRAHKDRDAGVALGAIAALRATAGAPGLVGSEDIKQPLVQCLAFPNKQVRVKAALALAEALPKAPFAGSENVVPVLSEALVQSGRQASLVVDGDEALRNKFQALMRGAGYECAVGANLYEALQNAKDANIVAFDVILLGSDIDKPDVSVSITELRNAFDTAATPILVIAKEGEVGKAARIARGAQGVEVLEAYVVDLGDAEKIKQQLTGRVSRASQMLGMSPLSGDLSLELAVRSANMIRLVLESNLSVYDAAKAGPALITALKADSQALRIASGHALALVGTVDAQEALAEYALDSSRDAAERIAAFGALAESGRRNGNKLGEKEVVSRLIEFTMSEGDLVLRAAASKALGALDLPSNKASEIIRAQYNG